MVLFAAGEKYEGLQKRLSRNEVAELAEAELIHLVHLQLGTPGSWSVDPKVHELDSSSYGGELLLIQEWTEIHLSCLKDFEEEVVCKLPPNLICPGKSSGPNGISHPHWVEIYDETNSQNNLCTKHTKFFLLQYNWKTRHFPEAKKLLLTYLACLWIWIKNIFTRKIHT